MQIDDSDEQLENASISIDDSFEPDSNVTAERARHWEKHDRQIRQTDAGIQMDETVEQYENVSRLIHESLESDSNITLEIL
jgi:hypothetical protein